VHVNERFNHEPDALERKLFHERCRECDQLKVTCTRKIYR
jgi:hypothetical protein